MDSDTGRIITSTSMENVTEKEWREFCIKANKPFDNEQRKLMEGTLAWQWSEFGVRVKALIAVIVSYFK